MSKSLLRSRDETCSPAPGGYCDGGLISINAPPTHQVPFFMPELPEVETTRRGIEPVLSGARVERVVVREPRLRWRAG